MTSIAEMQALAAVPSIAQHLSRINANLERAARALERIADSLEEEDEPTDNVLPHRWVDTVGKGTCCAYCGKTSAELGPEAAFAVCPSAPG